MNAASSGFKFNRRNCTFDMIFVMIYNDKNYNINTFYIDNMFIQGIHSNLKSLFAIIAAVFMTLLHFFDRLNDSFIEWIMIDNLYTYITK